MYLKARRVRLRSLHLSVYRTKSATKVKGSPDGSCDVEAEAGYV